jgi:hypothetical protein
MNAPRATVVAVALYAGSAGAQPVADGRDHAQVRVRIDTVFRGVPRYALASADPQASAADRYWRAVTLAPLMARATLDAHDLAGGRVEAHLNAWGAVDLAVVDPRAVGAGDLAVAWARYASGPWAVWAGRRFVAWGPPGGLHVDGVGAEARAGAFSVEVMIGRPVTPAYGALVGAQGSFEGVTASGGARVAWSRPGLLMASASYVERWARGVAGVRAVSLDALVTPNERLDVRASVQLDATGADVSQASADLDWMPTSWATVAAGYAHVDPSKLIPRWSILSVFATDVFDEGRASLVWRPSRAVSLRVAALRHAGVERRPALGAPRRGLAAAHVARPTASGHPLGQPPRRRRAAAHPRARRGHVDRRARRRPRPRGGRGARRRRPALGAHLALHPRER